MPAIGPFEKVSFNNNAAIFTAPDGSVIISTGTDNDVGAFYAFNFDGKFKVNGVELGGGSATPTDPTDPPTTPTEVPEWTLAALLNGVRNHPETPNVKNELAAFRKVGHRVELTGLLQVDSTMRAGDGFVLFVLPADCRPAQYQKLLPVALTNGSGTLKVLPNGNVILLSGQTDSYLSLHGVSFTLD